MILLLEKGGPIMGLLFLCAVIALIIFLERLFHLHRAQIRPGDFLEGIYNILRRRNLAEAVSICKDTPGPVAHIVRAAVLHHDDDAETRRRAVDEAGLAEIPRLDRRLGLLGVIGQTAPLLGLLGTVLGLIRLLMRMEHAAPLIHSGDLAGGLWEALLTTAAGLTIAVPVYMGRQFLAGRVEAIVVDMEQAAIEILAFLDQEYDRQNKRAPDDHTTSLP